ncbi:deoxyguanosinetriphosphate triphosphohydrolase [Saccharospirillum sp. HFRX-1]|uniref:deoxyguanosinetriphosphate triphosphohydrolase n=1 Tax=unclassified Saccharospirillum TaxID=2633430 RepID=UPI0037221BB1
MDWTQLLTTERYGHQAIDAEELGRSHFHKDHDRIVFSSAFRKLGGKTQVHPLAKNDHVHNRLIHSLEVGSVGRSLGIRVGERIREQLPAFIEPDDLGVIVQSACLAHDIGNPPFGHAGEYAIQDWFKQPENEYLLKPLSDATRRDLTQFEGNAQGFRIVAQVEYHLGRGGLRLTYPTLGASIKYPWTAEGAGAKGKFSCFEPERPILQKLAAQLGLVPRGEFGFARHPLSYLMEAADDICYALIDLEDAVELHILDFEEVRDVFQNIQGSGDLDLDSADNGISSGRQLAALRGKTIGVIVDAVVDAFIQQQDAILAGTFEGDLIASCPPRIQQGIQRAKTLAYTKVFLDTQKTETEIGAYAVLSTLLQAFITAGFELYNKGDQQQLSYRAKRVFDLMGDEAPAAQSSLETIYHRVIDHIAGMTDNYASYLARQIGGPSQPHFV